MCWLVQLCWKVLMVRCRTLVENSWRALFYFLPFFFIKIPIDFPTSLGSRNLPLHHHSWISFSQAIQPKSKKRTLCWRKLCWLPWFTCFEMSIGNPRLGQLHSLLFAVSLLGTLQMVELWDCRKIIRTFDDDAKKELVCNMLQRKPISYWVNKAHVKSVFELMCQLYVLAKAANISYRNYLILT